MTEVQKSMALFLGSVNPEFADRDREGSERVLGNASLE